MNIDALDADINNLRVIVGMVKPFSIIYREVYVSGLALE